MAIAVGTRLSHACGMGRLDSVPLFDELADGYDKLLPFFSTFGQRLVDLIGPASDSTLLDIGAGRGAVSIPAYAAGCTVCAVDASPRMMHCLVTTRPGLDVRVMDAHRLALADDSFDVAVASFVIHCVDDPRQVIREAVRVARPGGLIAMTVPGRCDDGGRWDRFNAIGSHFAPILGAAEVARLTDVESLFHDSDLRDVRQHSIEIRLPVDTPERAWEFQMSHGYAGYVRSFSQTDQVTFRQQALAELQRMHYDGGIDLHRAAEVTLGRVS